MAYININRIIDVQSIISSTPASRRDFSVPLFVFKGDEVNSQRINYYESYASIVETYGSNTEPAKAAQKYFSGGFLGLKPQKMYIANVASTATFTDVIPELLARPEYYMLAVDNTFTQDEQEDLADAIEASTNVKYFGFFLDTALEAASTVAASDTTSMLAYLSTNKFENSAGIYDDVANADEYKNLAAMSYFGTVDYTSARPLGCLAFKQMSGQTPCFQDLSAATIASYVTNIEAKNGNYYSSFGERGRDIFYKGVNGNGKFINIVIGANWLDYNMTYEIFDLLVNVPSLAYTNADFNMLQGAMARVLEQAKQFKLIAGGTDALTGIEYPNGYAISIPKPSQISASDKAQGILKNIIVTAIIAGNVVKITITNMLKY
jgi:hypothetical protein